MAFIQYLTFDGTALPLPDSYEVRMDDVEADSGGETEAGTVQRDVVRAGVVSIPVTEHPGDVLGIGKVAEDSDGV